MAAATKPRKTSKSTSRRLPAKSTAAHAATEDGRLVRPGIEFQPVSHVQWVHRDKLSGNLYNPNYVAPPEMALLKLSILEDGWLVAIVARPDGTIVDGYHRWLISADPDIYALTDGLVPVVYQRDVPLEHRMMSTIRLNRARGMHAVLKMADIVAEMVEYGLPADEIGARLGMEPEEVRRLLDRGNMLKRQAKTGFNTGWTVQG